MRACNLKDVQYVSSRCCVYKFSGNSSTNFELLLCATFVSSVCLCLAMFWKNNHGDTEDTKVA